MGFTPIIKQRKVVSLHIAASAKGGLSRYTSVLSYKESQRELSGESDATIRAAEIMALIAAVNACKTPCDIAVSGASKYVADAISGGIKRYIANGWMTTSNKQVANKELWMKLIADAKAKGVKLRLEQA